MRTNHVRWFWSLVAVLALAVAASPTFAADEQPSEDAVAVVNGSAVTQADLDREMNRVQRQFLMMGKPINDSQLAEVKKEALENLVDLELLYQQCQKEEIKVDEAAVDEQMSTLKKRFSSEDEFKDWLSKMNLSEAEVASQFKKEMAIQQFIDMKST
jgi:peptidyl-prolyl cis-trans isomerase C